ncbi:15279_t:CDS:2 [Dentiscutata heterogama]|uniref:15279_t:CDS:1 n=1 Tax=Dentiscutata heterogama TaxID=1316150 RepID=A0ACA9KVG1_9GLOM|nr:15279_t:CDS:2 [Dentiscutata heterogama]
MAQQNIQYICSICLKDISNYRSVTNDLKFKIDNCPDKEHYQKLRLNIDKLYSNLMETSRSNTPTNLIETNETLNLKCLPTGYHTAHLPSLDACDHCTIPIRYSTEVTKSRHLQSNTSNILTRQNQQVHDPEEERPPTNEEALKQSIECTNDTT